MIVVVEKDLGRLSIFLEKHGAFYHPARLRITAKDQPLSLVVNVAASNPGRQALPREVKALERLNDQRPFGWFPQVYGSTTVDLPMFLADWFDSPSTSGAGAEYLEPWSGHLTSAAGSGATGLLAY